MSEFDVFSSQFAHNIYKQKYSMDGVETWKDTCNRVVANVCAQLLDEETKGKIAKLMHERKFIPGGRYLYSSGRRMHQVNNCLSASTQFVTDKGIRSFSDFSEGDRVRVLNRFGDWEEATVHTFGEQELMELTFKNGDVIEATGNHRWWTTKEGARVTSEEVSRVPLTQMKNLPDLDQEGIRHGIIYGDGQVTNRGNHSEMIIVSDKKYPLTRYFEDKEVEVTVGGEAVQKFRTLREIKAGKKVALQPKHYKELPKVYSPGYARGFIAGLIATGGHASVDGAVTLSCEGLERARKIAGIAACGGCIVSKVSVGSRINPYDGSERELAVIRFKRSTAPIILPYHLENIRDLPEPFKERMYLDVVERRYTGRVEKVYCLSVPGSESFTLANGLVTSNCFLFRAHDSREGWADLMHSITASLMTGGGIGVDYSALREEGAKIMGSGGTSTGPLALMNMVNEAGRNIMQGGARRCLPSDALVTMADGTLKEMLDVEVGDLVATRFGPRRVTAKVDSGVQELIEVTTEHGSVRSTRNHKWLSTDMARRKTWMRASQLGVGHKLYYHPFTEFYDDPRAEEAYVLGYFVGDGCAYSSGRTHEITFQFDPRHVTDAQKQVFERVMSDFGNCAWRDGHGDCIELRVRSKEAVPLFQSIKAPHEVADFSWLEGYSLSYRAAFLAGWFDADGYYGKDSWRLASSHQQNRSEAMRLLRDFGLEVSENGEEVRLCSYQKSQYARTIGRYAHKNLPKPCQMTAEIPSRIKQIKVLPPEQTWDIEVEDVHEFIADGFVSHNSAIWAGLKWNHPDVFRFLELKDWSQEMRALKEKDFNFPLPMEGTNISVIYDTEFFVAHRDRKHPLHKHAAKVWMANCRQAFMTAEPGFSMNFCKDLESLRNAPVGADTNVLTSEGYARVGDIVDENVTVWTGKQWTETKFVKTKSDTATVRVKMTGGREIVCDPAHEFLIERFVGKGKERKLVSVDRVPAGQLKKGDVCSVNLPKSAEGEGDIDGVSRLAFSKLGYTLGYLYGDGSFHRRYPRAEVSVCCEDKEVCAEYFYDDLISSSGRDDKGYLRTYFKNSPLFNGRSKEVFPYDIYKKGDLFKRSFVAGLFDSDGSYDPDQHRIRLSSKHRVFLEDVRRLLESMGILSGINKAGKSTYGKKQGYLLCIYADSINQFVDEIPTKRLVPEKHTPYRDTLIKVLSVEPDEDQDVFCCDVGVEEHSFQAEGVIISNCTEVVSEDDSDKCNLGTIWLNRVESKEELAEVAELATQFLLCGGIYSDTPTDKIREVGEKNNRIGLGLGGLHEWLMVRGSRYQVTPELHKWLSVYEEESDAAAFVHAKKLGVAVPKGVRAIAPTGTIGILAETTTGIEPLFCKAYKRRYLKNGKDWVYEYVVDGSVKRLQEQGVPLDKIYDSYDISFKERVKFQADVQKYVDMSISSTCNLPHWGHADNNEETLKANAKTLMKYARRLRGFTCYPDGARGGQPLTRVSLEEAMKNEGKVFEEREAECVGGVCGV